MKKNKTFILLSVLLVILIGGAGFFYNKLSSAYKTDTLTETSPSSKNKEDSQPEENNEKAEIEEDAQTSDTEESDSSHDSQAEATETIPGHLLKRQIPAKMPQKRLLILL